MKANTPIQLQYIYRDNKPDLSFVLAVKRQQATRHIKRLLAASIAATGHKLDEWLKVGELEQFDKKHGTHLKQEYLQRKVDREAAALRAKLFEVEQAAERRRNNQGMFVKA